MATTFPSAAPTTTTEFKDANFIHWTFHYPPDQTAAAVAFGLFLLSAAIMFALTLWHGGKYMHIVTAVGLAEMVGYGTRILAATSYSLGPYIGSTLFLLISPVFLALCNYIVIGSLLTEVGAPVRVLCWKAVSPQRLARLFFCSDFTCFFIQCSGGGLLAAQSEAMQNMGSGIVLFGLAIQLAFFSAFAYITYTAATSSTSALAHVPALRPVFIGSSITILLLYIRNIYRVVEFASGMSGYVPTHEWTFYTFETIPILLACFNYCAFHFGWLLEAKSPSPEWKHQLELAKASRRFATGSGADDVSGNTGKPVTDRDGSTSGEALV